PSAAQMRQTMIPGGAVVLENPVGSAPGFSLVWRKALIVCLPGVPTEMEAMWFQEVAPILQAHITVRKLRPNPIIRKVFHTFGLPEADVDAKLKGLFPKRLPVNLGLLASPMGVLVSLTTQPGVRDTSAQRLIRALTKDVRERLNRWLYAEDHETMEEV